LFGRKNRGRGEVWVILGLLVAVSLTALMIVDAPIENKKRDPDVTQCKIRLEKVATALVTWSAEHPKVLIDSTQLHLLIPLYWSSLDRLRCPYSGLTYDFFFTSAKALEITENRSGWPIDKDALSFRVTCKHCNLSRSDSLFVKAVNP